MTATKEAHQPERDERLPQIDLAGRRASAAAASAASSPHSIIENNNYLYRPSCDNYILRYYYSTRFFGLSLDCTVRILLSYPLFHERREQHHHQHLFFAHFTHHILLVCGDLVWFLFLSYLRLSSNEHLEFYTSPFTMTRRSIILASGSNSSVNSNSTSNSRVEEPPEANSEFPLPLPAVLLLQSSKLGTSHQGGEQQDEDGSLSSSVSSLSGDEDEHDEEPPSTPSKPRSIFENYWKAEGECPPRQLSPPQRSTSPMCVMQDPYYQPPYSPTMDMLLVGQALRVLEDDGDDDDDMNTYERTLRYCEAPLPNWRRQQQQQSSPLGAYSSPYASNPLWMMSWFGGASRHQSAPSFLTTHSARHNNLQGLSGTRKLQSDSALLTSPLKPALRQGRFSSPTAAAAAATTKRTSTATAPSNNNKTKATHVRFQPRIQVCAYQPPVESWAAEGWSQWFGS